MTSSSISGRDRSSLNQSEGMDLRVRCPGPPGARCRRLLLHADPDPTGARRRPNRNRAGGRSGCTGPAPPGGGRDDRPPADRPDRRHRARAGRQALVASDRLPPGSRPISSFATSRSSWTTSRTAGRHPGISARCGRLAHSRCARTAVVSGSTRAASAATTSTRTPSRPRCPRRRAAVRDAQAADPVDGYRELGHPDGNVDQAFERAVIELLKTPVIEGDVALASKSVAYEFADPRLQSLSSAQRQFLRMGSRNVRLIQAKLREIAPLVGIPVESLPVRSKVAFAGPIVRTVDVNCGSIRRLSAEDRGSRLRRHRRHAVHAAWTVTGACTRSRRRLRLQPRSRPAPAAAPASRTIRLEAIVTDKLGTPIANLRAGDFTVLDDGVAQKVDSVDWTLEHAAGGRSRRACGRDQRRRGRRARGAGARAPASSRLYLDEYHVSAGESTERVRARRVPFHRRAAAPGRSRRGDEAARPSDEHPLHARSRRRRGGRQQLQRAPQRLHAALAVRGAVSRPIARCGARRARADRDVRTCARWRPGWATSTAASAGIVLLSEGFTTDVPRARERRLPDLQGLVRAASRFRVLAVRVRSGRRRAAGSADATGDRSRPRGRIVGGAPEPGATDGRRRRRAGQDLGPALQRVSRDLDSYYVLTFTVDASRTTAAFTPFRSRSSRRDAQVRARSGYWAPLPSELRAATARLSPPPILPMRALRRSPFIESWFGLTVEPDGGRRVIFTWTPSPPRTAARGKAAGAARRRGAQGHDAGRHGAVRWRSRGRRVRATRRASGPTAQSSRRRQAGCSSI